MGSLLGKLKPEETTTPSRESALKRIEDPRSPTDEISRTPIEVTDDVPPKESLRHLAFANALKMQNKTVYESSPIYPKSEKFDKDSSTLPKFSLTTALDSIPILEHEDSINVSDIDKENLP